jgi:hypothetical protein
LDAVRFVLLNERFIVAYATWLVNRLYRDAQQKMWSEMWQLVALGLCHPLVHAQLVFLNEYATIFHTPEFAWSQKSSLQACEMPHRTVQRARFLSKLSTLSGIFATMPLTQAAAETLGQNDRQRFEGEVCAFVQAVRNSFALHGYRWLRAPLCLAALGHKNEQLARQFASDLLALAEEPCVQTAAASVPFVVPPLPDRKTPFYKDIPIPKNLKDA